jgi:hypothetical protein
MKGNPAVPGGSLKSKPAWSDTLWCFTAPAFFACGGDGRPQRARMNVMEKPDSTMARKIAQAASVFEQQRTGNTPKSVTVVLSDTTLVITLHGAVKARLVKSTPSSDEAGPLCGRKNGPGAPGKVALRLLEKPAGGGWKKRLLSSLQAGPPPPSE